MNTDIRLSVDFPTHPKTKKLKRRLGAEGVLALVALFIYAAQRRPDGNLSGMSNEDIALAADWDGEPDEFVAALVDVKFIDLVDGAMVIHDYSENQPWVSKSLERSTKAKAAADKRWETQRKAIEGTQQLESDALNMLAALPEHESSNAPFLSSPSLTNTPLPPKGDAVSDVDLLPDPKPRRSREDQAEPEWFSKLWEANPRKVGKVEALKAAKRLSKGLTQEQAEHIVYAWSRYVADYKAKKGDDFSYLKHVSSWLNASRWEDYEPVIVKFTKASAPWAAAIEKYIHPPHVPGYTAPDEVAVMNLADEVGADPYKARELCRAEGLEAAASWALANGKEAAG
jgi:hypothetical protein